MSVAHMPRASTNVERRLFELEAELRRIKSKTLGWRSVDDYIAALKFFDETLQPAFDAVRAAIVDAYTPEED